MRLSNKLLKQGYVRERLKSSLRKFYGRYGNLIKQYEVSLSQMLNDILYTDHIQWQPPTDQTLYRTRPFTEFWVVSIEHLRRVWHADRGRLLLRLPGPVPLVLAYVLLVETNPSFSELVVIFPDYALRIYLGTFSISLSTSSIFDMFFCNSSQRFPFEFLIWFLSPLVFDTWWQVGIFF